MLVAADLGVDGVDMDASSAEVGGEIIVMSRAGERDESRRPCQVGGGRVCCGGGGMGGAVLESGGGGDEDGGWDGRMR